MKLLTPTRGFTPATERLYEHVPCYEAINEDGTALWGELNSNQYVSRETKEYLQQIEPTLIFGEAEWLYTKDDRRTTLEVYTVSNGFLFCSFENQFEMAFLKVKAYLLAIINRESPSYDSIVKWGGNRNVMPITPTSNIEFYDVAEQFLNYYTIADTRFNCPIQEKIINDYPFNVSFDELISDMKDKF